MLLLIDEKLKWQCKEGHIWEATLYYIKKFENLNFFKLFLGQDFNVNYIIPPRDFFNIIFLKIKRFELEI
jgi:hypothetical protein